MCAKLFANYLYQGTCLQFEELVHSINSLKG